MIFIIGGVARAGKSTLAQIIGKTFEGQIISGDSVRVALMSVSKPEWHPNLFHKIIDPIKEDDSHEKQIARLKARDQDAWRFLDAYCQGAVFEGDNVLVNGIIWPSMLKSVSYQHKAVFLVDTSSDQAKRAIAMRDTEQTRNNWMKDQSYTDKMIVNWARFNVERSNLIINECKQNGFEYFDIANGGIESTQKHALEFLRSSGLSNRSIS